MLLPALARAKASAMDIRCRNNVKQIGTLFTSYSIDFQGWLMLADNLNGDGTTTPWAQLLFDLGYHNGKYSDYFSAAIGPNDTKGGIFRCQGHHDQQPSYAINVGVTAGPTSKYYNYYSSIAYYYKINQITRPSQCLYLTDSVRSDTTGSRTFMVVRMPGTRHRAMTRKTISQAASPTRRIFPLTAGSMIVTLFRYRARQSRGISPARRRARGRASSPP